MIQTDLLFPLISFPLTVTHTKIFSIPWTQPLCSWIDRMSYMTLTVLQIILEVIAVEILARGIRRLHLDQRFRIFDEIIIGHGDQDLIERVSLIHHVLIGL